MFFDVTTSLLSLDRLEIQQQVVTDARTMLANHEREAMSAFVRYVGGQTMAATILGCCPSYVNKVSNGKKHISDRIAGRMRFYLEHCVRQGA